MSNIKQGMLNYEVSDHMKKILLIAGEVSGDHHAAAMLTELNRLHDVKVFGIGGDALSAAGMELIYHSKNMAFLGIGEVIKHLPFIREVHSTLLKRAKIEQPDAVVLIDYPGFNLRFARAVKKLNIPVIYYITPQVWAWGKGRIKKIKRYIDKLLVIFPFEKEFYKQHNIDSEYVGHPLVDKHFPKYQKQKEVASGTSAHLGLLPGSREQEVIALLPKMIETARLLYKNKKITAATVVTVDNLPSEIYNEYIDSVDTFLTLSSKSLEEIIPDFTVALVASGTATLETGYYGLPSVIVYHVSKLTYTLGKWLVKLPYIGLVNIVAGKMVARELIQESFTPEIAAGELELLLIPEKNREVHNELAIIREKLGEPGASKRAAEHIIRFLTKPV